MAIITISRGSYSKGKEIAEKVAQELNYEHTSRDVLLEASEHFNVPEIKLVRALHDAPSILNRFTYGKEKYVAYIKEAFLEHMIRDDIVYHGLAGHFFLKGVSHALKIRIIADLEDRVTLEMERENISREEALHLIQKDDFERRKWSLALYGVDTVDASLYDLVIHINKIKPNDAINLIYSVVHLPQFETTPQSQKAIENLAFASKIEAAVVQIWPKVKVSAHDNIAFINLQAPLIQEEKLTRAITAEVEKIPEVKDIRISVHPDPDVTLNSI
jgi:cytidylate kinase